MLSRFIASLSIILVTLNASAEKLILIEARQTSGFTRMEDAFENICKLDASGLLFGTLKHGIRETGGWSQEVRLREHLSKAELDSIKSLLSESEQGPFREEPGSCDTGDFVIRGKRNANPFAIVEIHDCGPSVINTSPSARKIENWLFSRCHWVK